MVVAPNRVGHGKGPEGNELETRPVKCGMQHIRSCHVTDSSYSALGYTILEFGSNATVRELLTKGGTVLTKFLRIENAVV